MESSRIGPADPKTSSLHSKYGEPRPLNLGCKIFISHSGRDKEFVRFLHDRLVNQVYRDKGLVFFDEESLPTAEPISMENILAEARGCELGILVLTKDFFMHTPNPMLELETLTTSNVRLLPLFFRISVDDFKKMKRENVWEEQWKEWLKRDEGRLGAWKHALKFVDRFSGLEKCKRGVSELDYIKEIVDKVAGIVHPTILFGEEGVCGMDRLCKIVNNMYNQCALKSASDGCTVVSTSASAVCREDKGNSLDLVGIYGFAGLGKSTLCRSLCDFYFADFRGKVCCLDLGSKPHSSHALSQTDPSDSPSIWRMQYLLSKLKGRSGSVDLVTSFEIQNLLRNWIKKDPIFLAIDNILPDQKSLEEAHFYLEECEFATGSKIFITSRSRKLLEQVTSDLTRFAAVIEHIPALKLKEARGIFERRMGDLMLISNVEDEVNECVSACVIHIGDDLHHERDVDNRWYHPLMLKSAAASIRYGRRCHVDLKSMLREFMHSATTVNKSDALKMVFDMLDITYAILSKKEKKVFLDLALFYKVIDSQSGRGWSSYAWIRSVHSHLVKTELEDILRFLEDLSFILMEDHYHQRGQLHERVQLHDLMVDFSMYKIKQGADAAGFNPHCLLLDNGAQLMNPEFDFLLAKAATRNEWPSKSAPPKSVRTISISRCGRRPDPGVEQLDLRNFEGVEQLDLRNFEGVEVLSLVDNPGVQEVLLSCTTFAHLRSFIVRVPGRHRSLRCTIDECWPTRNQMMTGGKLVWVELEGNVILSTCRKRGWWWPESLQPSERSRSSTASLGILQPFLCNLQYLALSWFPAQSIDVMTCTNLRRMLLSNIHGLRDIHGLETLTNLEELQIQECSPKIIDVTACTNLKKLKLWGMANLTDIHGLETLTSFDAIWIDYCGKLRLLSIPAKVRWSVRTQSCRSLQRISIPTMAHPEAVPSSSLSIWDCPALKDIGGLAQFMAGCEEVAIQDLLESVETGAYKFQATVTGLTLGRYRVQGLAGLRMLALRDVQHAGLLISALVKAQATDLYTLKICCKEDGDCGCDKIEPHFHPGLSPSFFEYHCPKVRNIASLPLIGNRLRHLSLRGCGNVEVWPDFATMTSLVELDLSYTSLKEWPTGGVQLLGRLKELDIQGCLQLPAEEMIKAITYKPLGRGSLASLLADLRGHRRDQGYVADALDSQWPELVSLFREQWQYLRYPCPILYSSRRINEHEGSLCGAELCYLIRLMYDLWFGVECEAGSTSIDCYPCADGVPTIKEKLKRLLCSEIFMSLPFYVWRIGRTRLHALDEWEGYPWPEGYEIYMAFSLIGSASIGYFNVSLNDDLKDRMVNFIQSFAEAQPQRAVVEDFDDSNVQLDFTTPGRLEKDIHERLVMRVGDAVCKMARAPSVAATLGQDFMHITMDGLKASYNSIKISNEADQRLSRCLSFTIGTSRRNRQGKIPCVGLKSGKTSLDDDLGARVLRKIMPKILPLSVLEFNGKISGVNEW